MIKNKMVLILLVSVVGLSLILCCTNENSNSNIDSQSQGERARKTDERSGQNEIKLGRKCSALVKDFEGEYIEPTVGRLVVVGNEPFTKLVFRKNDKNEDMTSDTYLIVKDCSKDLWNLQSEDLRVEGKTKTDYLETVTGQKMKVVTLYPIKVSIVPDQKEG